MTSLEPNDHCISSSLSLSYAFNFPLFQTLDLDGYFKSERMNATVLDSQDKSESPFDGVLFMIICLVFSGVLIGVCKLCYNYSRNFPDKSGEEPALNRVNRRCISVKGARGNRFSVA